MHPHTLLFDGMGLARVRDALRARDRLDQPVAAALAIVRTDAAPAASAERVTVTGKPAPPPPSGDRHDYASLTPYWWPDPTRPDGLPYVYRDGEVNPEVSNWDRPRLEAVVANVVALALSAYRDEAPHATGAAAEMLRSFFLDPRTRMNPNMNHGQFIPGRADGTPAALVDARALVPLVDALRLLRAATTPLPADIDAGMTA